MAPGRPSSPTATGRSKSVGINRATSAPATAAWRPINSRSNGKRPPTSQPGTYRITHFGGYRSESDQAWHEFQSSSRSFEVHPRTLADDPSPAAPKANLKLLTWNIQMLPTALDFASGALQKKQTLRAPGSSSI